MQDSKGSLKSELRQPKYQYIFLKSQKIHKNKKKLYKQNETQK